jgi:signal transduction histidine kinase/ligand-binding sensor domain-containing protein
MTAAGSARRIPRTRRAAGTAQPRMRSFWADCILRALLAICPFHPLHAADSPPSWLYRSWHTDEGLPDNSVTGLAQTSDGYVWVGTLGGLLRFNGKDFTDIPLPRLGKASNRVVRSVYRDRQDRLWLGMERGHVLCLDAETIHLYGPDDGLPSHMPQSISEDNQGNLWLAYAYAIARIREGKCETFGADHGIPMTRGSVQIVARRDGIMAWQHGEVLSLRENDEWKPVARLSNEISEICAAGPSGLWVCDGNRIRSFSNGALSEEIACLPEKAITRVMREDRFGVLWIGTASDGLFRLENGQLEAVPTSHSEVECLLEDREGNLWAGTMGGGLNQVRPQILTLLDRRAGLPTDSARSVCEDASGAIWVAFENGQLARMSGGTWEDLSRDGISFTCLTADRQGAVWLGTRGHGLHRFSGGRWQTWKRSDGLSGNSIRSIFAASNGAVWLAAEFPRRLQCFHQGTFRTIELPDDLAEIRSIRAMTEAADGTIWIGTAGGELMRVDHDKLVHERASGAKADNSIRSLHATPDGNVWIAHAGAGLGHWSHGAQSRITTANGLLDDHVSQILTDAKDSMWLAGNRGLFQLNMSEVHDVLSGRSDRLRSRVFGRAEGLAGLQASFDYSPSACQARDGRLWFAMRNGLLMVRPDKIRENPTVPPVILEQVVVDERTFALYDKARLQPRVREGIRRITGSHQQTLRLGPGHQKLEFAFAALSFTSPENVHFRYQLLGFDQKPIEAGTLSRATYPRLPAGSYEFRVSACNHAGVWNETGAAIRLTVEPFYWQTWWFRSLTLALFTAGVIAIVRYASFRRLREKMRKLKQQAALHQERARIARDMHDEVGAKLTRLSLLSDMASTTPGLPPEADADVREISETARETILAFDEIVWAVNPRNDTLGDLVGYLCRHAEDFFEGGPTECTFHLPQTIPPISLPTEIRHEVFLAAKEAMTNVAKSAGASHVSLRLALRPESFEITIEDDGCGFDPASLTPRPGGGNGLLNLHERMRRIGGNFSYHSQPGAGTRITFLIPFAKPATP